MLDDPRAKNLIWFIFVKGRHYSVVGKLCASLTNGKGWDPIAPKKSPNSVRQSDSLSVIFPGNLCGTETHILLSACGEYDDKSLESPPVSQFAHRQN